MTGIATLVLGCLAATAGGEDLQGTVMVTNGKARFAHDKRSGDARHSLTLTLRVGPKYLSDFHEPDAHDLRAVLGDTVLFEAPAGSDGYKLAKRGRWRYRGDGAGGKVKVSANGWNGRIKIKLSRAVLTDLRGGDATDLPLTFEMTGAHMETEASFHLKDGRTRRWKGLADDFVPRPDPNQDPGQGPDPGPGGGGPVSFRALANGLDSSYFPKQNLVVRSQAEWVTLWNRHKFGGGTPPSVNFSRDMVIATFIGIPTKINSPGMTATVRVRSVTDTASRREVVVEEVVNGAPWSCPPPGVGAPCILPDPYDFVLAPKSSLPVTFLTR